MLQEEIRKDGRSGRDVGATGMHHWNKEELEVAKQIVRTSKTAANERLDIVA
jgi:hypothetical protein